MSNISACTTSRRPLEEKYRFYNELAGKYELRNPSEVVFKLGDFGGYVGEEIEGFEGVHGGNGKGKRNAEGRMPLKLCDKRELCVANTWFKKTNKRNIMFKYSNDESEIDFILVCKKKLKIFERRKGNSMGMQH